MSKRGLSIAAVSLVILVGCGGGGDGVGPIPSPDPPTLVITTPLAGASVTQGTIVDIDVSVSAPAGVDRVVFLIDGINRGTDNAPPFTYEWHTAAESIGDHVINVTVFDQFTPPRFASAVRTVSVVQPAAPMPDRIEMSVNTIRLFWDPPPPTELELQRYQIQRSVNAGPWLFIDGGLCGKYCTTFADFDVAPPHTYKYRIRAVYTSGTPSAWALFDTVIFTGE